MSNPYESPKAVDNARPQQVSGQSSTWRKVLYGFGGALLGYVTWAILASLENFQFYTIRRTLTGETNMPEIIDHPADRWIVLGLFLSFIFGGVFVGFWIARRQGAHANNYEPPLPSPKGDRR